MFRLTRPLFTAVTKRSTGIVGLKVHHDPLPELKKTYEATLQTLSAIPQTSVYRQGTEALTLHKLKVLERANGDVSVVETELDEGHIEESLDIAQDELSVANKMLEWKAYVHILFSCSQTHTRATGGNLWRRNLSLDSGNTSARRLLRPHRRNWCTHMMYLLPISP